MNLSLQTIPVEIVRPKRAHSWTLFVGRLLLMFLSVWIVMLALGALTPWHLGYWETGLAILGIRLAQAPETSYLNWTRKP